MQRKISENSVKNRILDNLKKNYKRKSLSEIISKINKNIYTKDDFDIETDFQRYTDSSEKAAEWDTLMRKFQKRTPFTNEYEWWAPMKRVFNLNTK